MKLSDSIKVGDTLEFRKVAGIRNEYKGARLVVKELNYNGTAYHSGVVGNAGHGTLFHPKDVKKVKP
jgi:hypothetical protein